MYYSKFLCQKAEKEFNEFKDSLKSKSADEIIESAYELTVKGELLLLIEEYANGQLDREIIKALCRTEHVLDMLYQAWLKEDSEFLELIDPCCWAYLYQYAKELK